MRPELGGGSRAPAETVPARPVADAVVRGRDGQVEITLAPDELGRVTVILGAEDQAGRLGLLVERTETLELIRRHADQLVRDLRDHGMPDAQMGFLRQDGGDGTRHRGSAQPSALRAATDDAPRGEDETGGPVATGPATRGGRLDIRM